MTLKEPRKLIALTAGLLGFLLVYGTFRWKERQLLEASALMPVVVAKTDIQAGQILRSDQLRVRQVPRLYAPPSSLERVEGAIGRMAVVPFAAAEPILGNKLSRAGAVLSTKVAEGRRAFTVPVDEVSSLSGLVRPGDLADILFTFDLYENERQVTNFTATLLQAVRLLAVGSDFTGEGPEKSSREDGFLGGFQEGEYPGTVTLDVSPEQAELLLFCMSQGRVALSLRSPEDLEFSSTTVTTFEEILKRTGLSRVKVRELPRRPTVEIIRGTRRGSRK